MNGDCVLKAREVVKSFGSTPALRGASVAVDRGEILAVMGPSGSGKSTLLAVAIVSAGLGPLVAELFLHSQLGLNLRPPGPAYYGFVAGGVLLSLGIIAATFPLLTRITGPEAARSE